LLWARQHSEGLLAFPGSKAIGTLDFGFLLIDTWAWTPYHFIDLFFTQVFCFLFFVHYSFFLGMELLALFPVWLGRDTRIITR
jgi:hypothetical protein